MVTRCSCSFLAVENGWAIFLFRVRAKKHGFYADVFKTGKNKDPRPK